MLIVFAGLPGSGKSTIARELGRRSPAPVLSVDPVEAALLRSGIDREQPTGLAAYVVVEAMAAEVLSLGQTVVVDAVNDAEEAREQWRNLAGRQGAPLAWIEVVCSDPDLHRHRLAGRDRGLPGFPEPTWASLEARRPGLTAWTDERLVLDSVRGTQINVETALDHLRTARVRGIGSGVDAAGAASSRRSGRVTRRGRLPKGDGPDS